MMKKIFILCIILIFQTSITNAGNCLILNQTADVLKTYLENNRKVIKNITNEITSSNTKSDLNFKNKMTSLYNNIISVNGYESYFYYYVIFPIANDISKEIKRDYRLLENESKGLNIYLKTIANQGNNNPITKACLGVTTNCNVTGTSFEIVGKLIKNQSKIIDLYRRAVMGDLKNTENIDDLILIDNSDNKFLTELNNNYGYGNNCTASEGSFFATIGEKIKNIGDYTKNYKKGIDEWKEAIALLNGDDKKANEEHEKKLLITELSRQGISGDRAKTVISNLQKYNANGGFSKDNNFITNTYNQLSDKIGKEVDKFNTNIIGEFKKIGSEKETKTIKSILNDTKKVDINLSIAESVNNLYNNELPFIEVGDENTSLIRTDILNMHNNLNDGIKKLNDLYKISEKVCDDQDKGNGNCKTN